MGYDPWALKELDTAEQVAHTCAHAHTHARTHTHACTHMHTRTHMYTHTHIFMMPRNVLQPDPLTHVEGKRLPSVTTCVVLTFYLIELFHEVWGRAVLFRRERNYRCWLLRG